MSIITRLLICATFVFIASVSAEKNDSWSLLPSFVKKVYDDCERKDYDLYDCLRMKTVLVLDRLAKSDVIEIDESTRLVREGSRLDHSRALSETDVEGAFNAENQSEGGGKLLNRMIFDRVSRFLGTHSLRLNFPKFNLTTLARDMQEGRGKMKKTMSMFMTMAMMKAMMMIPMSIGTLFILAGKALIISKIALVLSLMILLKKLISKPTEHVVHESHGWAPSAGSGGWDRRSYKQPEPSNSPHAAYPSNSPYASYPSYNQNQQQLAQNLAYNSYINH